MWNNYAEKVNTTTRKINCEKEILWDFSYKIVSEAIFGHADVVFQTACTLSDILSFTTGTLK